MTRDLAHSFTATEVVKLVAATVQGLATFSALRDLRDVPLVSEIQGDYDAAVFHLVSNDLNAGLSKWASLQATEKMLKAFIASKNNHNIEHLAKQAVALGLTPPPPHYIEAVACKAGVRYGEIAVSPKEALLAHLVSLEMGDVASRCTALALGRPVAQVSEPLMDGIPMTQFLQQQGVTMSGPFDLS